MAAPANCTEYLELVKKSGVAEDKRFDAYLQKLRAAGTFPTEAGKLAALLVQDGLLTQFQAEQLLQGKWKRFSIGKYKVLEKLGSGGMGNVFLCEHKLMRRRVALKVLPAARASDEESLKRFYREARAVAALDHPNIVHAYDIDQDDNLHFIVLEYVDGTNLQDLVKHTGPMAIAQACHYIRQIALGLDHAHQKNLVHRDVKPANILVDRKGVIKILDLGLARFFNDEDDLLTKKFDDNVLGTADYLAPEQAEDSHDVDIRADIYSLGATFYFLLTGKTPFGDGTIAQKLLWHGHKQPRPINELRPEVPEALWAIITKMMAKEASQRYQVPREVAEALAPYEQAVAPPPESEMPALSPAAAPTSTASSGFKLGISSVGPNSEPFESFEEEPVDTVARSDTPSQGRRPDRGKNSERNRLVLVAGGVSCFFLAVLGFILVKYVFNQPTLVVKELPPLKVFRDARPPDYPTVQQALRYAKPGDIIQLHDEVHQENLYVDPANDMKTDVIVEAAPGKEVRWISQKQDDNAYLIYLYKAKKFRLRGRGITLDGNLADNKQLKNLVFISSNCPGLKLEDLRMQGFSRTAVTLMNTMGAPEDPIRFVKLETTTTAKEKPLAAIYFDVNPKMQPNYNDFVDIENCVFTGLDPVQAVGRRDAKVLGTHIKHNFRN